MGDRRSSSLVRRLHNIFHRFYESEKQHSFECFSSLFSFELEPKNEFGKFVVYGRESERFQSSDKTVTCNDSAFGSLLSMHLNNNVKMVFNDC